MSVHLRAVCMYINMDVFEELMNVLVHMSVCVHIHVCPGIGSGRREEAK